MAWKLSSPLAFPCEHQKARVSQTHRNFVYEDELVIVDPSDMEIVAILPV